MNTLVVELKDRVALLAVLNGNVTQANRLRAMTEEDIASALLAATAAPPAAPSGQALKKLMHRKGLSYRVAAVELGTHASYLSDILNCRRGHPGYALRNRLAVLLEEMN